MQLTAHQICNIIKGDLVGNPNTIISSYSNIKNAQKGDVTFLSDMRYKKYIKNSKASLIIVPDINISTNTTIIKTKKPAIEFTKILDLFLPKEKNPTGLSQSAKIHKKTTIGKNVFIDKLAIIEELVNIQDNCLIRTNTFIGKHTNIGKNCKIGPNVTIYHNTTIGDNCIIHAGAVIGSDGFGFMPNNKELIKIPQLGKVIINNNVEIGANTTIDRGTFENTIINDNVKLDNLIQIGHNVSVGKNTIIAAQSGIAGSVFIGENCMIGGQVAISDHIKIGNNVKIAGKSGIIKNIPDNKIVQGPLAFDIKNFQKSYIHFKNLDNIVTELEKIKKIAENPKK
tara:strand:+ start:377 stop:1396 length:1020 start_codon:yes stop_codon:yes gene_type:complete